MFLINFHPANSFPFSVLFTPSPSSPSCPGTTTQRVQPAAQLAGTVPQPHPQRAAYAPERHLSRVLPAAAQRGRQQQWRRLFFHLSQLSISSFSSQQRYLSKLSCQLRAFQSIPAPRYVPDPGKDASLLCYALVLLLLSWCQQEANCC